MDNNKQRFFCPGGWPYKPPYEPTEKELNDVKQRVLEIKRKNTEEEIFKKIIKIWNVYKEYNPNGKCLSIDFDDNDSIWVHNSIWGDDDDMRIDVNVTKKTDGWHFVHRYPYEEWILKNGQQDDKKEFIHGYNTAVDDIINLILENGQNNLLKYVENTQQK